jgi:hypothetical protein
MRARLALSLALVSAADALYVALTRPLVGVDAYGVGALVLLATVESLAFIPAFAAASLSEVLGRRRVAVLAIAAAPGVLALLPPRDLPAMLAGGALYSFSTATLYNLVVAGTLEEREEALKSYAVAGLGMSLGWGLGSTAAWPLYYALGPSGAAAAVLAMIASAAALGVRGEGDGSAGAIEAMLHPLRTLGALLPVAAAGSALHTVGMSAYGVELDRALGSLLASEAGGRMLYGLFRGGLPVLLEAALRLRSSELVERFGGARLLLASVWLSAMLYSLLPLLPAHAVVAAWFAVVAVFTLYDVALYALVAERVDGLEGAAVGALSLASGAGNLAVAPLEGWLAVKAVYALVAVGLAAAATAPVVAETRRAAGERLFAATLLAEREVEAVELAAGASATHG